jgi:predicted DNA-binding protein
MKKEELEELVDEETVALQASRDDPLSDRAVRKGQSRSVVYSVRLTPEQTEEIQQIASEAGIPASALVRDWVVEGLAAERDSATLDSLVDVLSRDVDKIRRRLARREAS